MASNVTVGWNWAAFVLGPFWYLYNGMFKKGSLLLFLCAITFFCAAPFVWVYCGARGAGDWYDYKLKETSKYDLNEL